MERLSLAGMRWLDGRAWRHLPGRLAWGLKVLYGRSVRQLGIAGSIGLVVSGTIVVLLAVLITQHQAVAEMTHRRAELSQVAHRNEVTIQAPDHSDARSRLALFRSYLTKHEDIPVVVGSVLRLAEDEGLLMQRGDYRPQVDGTGGFLRYRMNLPVTGDPDAINRFIRAALAAHRSLALESIHFGRERLESGQIEARLQWTLFTRLPASPDGGDAGDKEQQ